MNQPPSSYIGERPSEHCLCLLMLINLHLVLSRAYKRKDGMQLTISTRTRSYSRIQTWSDELNLHTVLKIKISIF